MDNHIAGLLAKVLSREASAEEMAEVEIYMNNNPDAAQQFELLKKLWPGSGNIPTSKKLANLQEDKKRLARIIERASKVRTDENSMVEKSSKGSHAIRQFSAVFLKYAALIIVIITCTLFITKNNNHVQPGIEKDIEVTAENGSRKRVMLPDGSTVLLNAGSKLQYPAKFNDNTREVTMLGEAFFDVVKHSGQPFIVHASGINIKVLGTAFNVKSYPEEDAIETTLIRGLIEINRQDENQEKSIYLYPNQKITIPRCGDCIPKSGKNNKVADVKNVLGNIIVLDSSLKDKEIMETAWIYNRLEFRKNTFREIAKKLERWYNVKVFIDDDSLAGIKLNGSFESETLEQALSALQKTTSFNFKIKNNEVFINVHE